MPARRSLEEISQEMHTVQHQVFFSLAWVLCPNIHTAYCGSSVHLQVLSPTLVLGSPKNINDKASSCYFLREFSITSVTRLTYHPGFLVSALCYSNNNYYIIICNMTTWPLIITKKIYTLVNSTSGELTNSSAKDC